MTRCSLRKVEGMMDADKVEVLNTCMVGRCREVISVHTLAMEMKSVGLEGMEIMWVIGSMVLLLFTNLNSRQATLDMEVPSTWFSCVVAWSHAVGLHENLISAST
ncbi:hypothetical protein V6N13_018921 [Hibiscus sabdariffa]